MGVSAPLAPIVAITPGDGRDLGPWLEALGGAGLGTVVLRERALSTDAYEALVDEALRWVPQVIAHAKNPAARAIAVRRGLPLHYSSSEGPGPVPGGFGVSCHAAADLDAAFASGAAWAFLSPVWAPLSKMNDVAPLGPEAFFAACSARPVWALGGITPDRFRLLRARGAAGVAVLGALFGAASPALAASNLRAFGLV